MRLGSVSGLPSRSIIQPTGISSPRCALSRTLPNAATVGAMSSTIGGSSPAGMAMQIGLVPSRFSTEPQGGRWLLLPTAKIDADHVVSERHRGIERGGAGMIAHARADPGDALRLGLLDRRLRRKLHHQMADAVVAIDQRGGRPILHDADVGARIVAAGLQPPDVDGQADDAMGVGAAQIGLDHQRRDGFGVGGRQAGRLERALGEGDKLRRGDARRGGGFWLGARCWLGHGCPSSGRHL